MDGDQEDDGPIDGQGEANVSDTNTIDTIFQAARENRPDVVKQLIEEGTPVRAIDNRGWTALHHAAFLGHTECVRQGCQMAIARF